MNEKLNEIKANRKEENTTKNTNMECNEKIEYKLQMYRARSEIKKERYTRNAIKMKIVRDSFGGEKNQRTMEIVKLFCCRFFCCIVVV